MIWLKYDWCEDRCAFLRIDSMRENLWSSLHMKRLIIKITYRDLNLDTVRNSVGSSVWKKWTTIKN